MLSTINLTVNGQELMANSTTVASGLIEEITCSFTFSGSDWSGFSTIYALFQNKQRGIVIEKELSNNACTVPQEVLTKKGDVYVNLCGYTRNATTQLKTLQMTSYKTKIVEVLQNVNVEGENSNPTPETWRTELAELQEEIDEKSTVSVSSTGTSTDAVKYITIDGTEKKLGGDELPTVVNDRYLHTNSSTGALEWSEVDGGNLFIANYYDEGREGTSTTYSEVLNAYNAGKTIVCHFMCYSYMIGNLDQYLLLSMAMPDDENYLFMFDTAKVDQINDDYYLSTPYIGLTTEGWVRNNISINFSDYAKTADLATVAETGSYNDLNNKPTIPQIPTAINDRYLHTNASTGALEWSSITGIPTFDATADEGKVLKIVNGVPTWVTP